MLDDLAIRVQDLRKTYRDGFLGRKSVSALNGVTFELPRGQIFGLLGPNGAGKTTLIKVLLGIVRRTRGEASLFGYPAGDRRGRKHVGYLPEGHRIPPHHTGNSALEFLGQLSGMRYREIRSRRTDLLGKVGLEKWGTTSIRKYSKGMQQRLGLAQAMLHDPELLILDEPTDGVDPVGRSDMREILNGFRNSGKTVFINSHLLQEIELVCDKVAILHGGLLRREAAVDDLTELSRGAIRIRIICDEPEASRLCDSIKVLTETPPRIKPTANARVWDVECSCGNQSDADRFIDHVRSEKISIQSFMPVTRTLEEAFLAIIQSEPTVEKSPDGQQKQDTTDMTGNN